jgi:hypothetical protein
MAITKHTHSTSHQINPYYIKVEDGAGLIIIDDLTGGGRSEIWNEELPGPIEWLKIEDDAVLTILTEAPDDLNLIAVETIANWNLSRAIIGDHEIFHILYTSTPLNENNRVACISYTFGSNEAMWLKIDRDKDELTFYKL